MRSVPSAPPVSDQAALHPESAAERSLAERSLADTVAPSADRTQRGTGTAIRRLQRDEWETLIEAHRNAVFAYLRARLFTHVDADDLAQEVFLRCCQVGAPAGAPSEERAWLLGIARNVLREHIRSQQRRKEVSWAELCLDLDELAAAKGPASETGAELDHCLESLGPSARQALELRFHDDLSLSEIGVRLRRSEGAVKLLMYRSRQALRHCLDRRSRASHDD